MPPAKTGIDSRSSTAVRPMPHTMRLTLAASSFAAFKQIGLAIKLIEAMSLLTPPICSAPIAKSTLVPGWPAADSGGYIVHPVPAPTPLRLLITNVDKAGGRSQNLKLFRRG